MTKKRWFMSIAPDFSMQFWLDKQWRNGCIKSRTCLYNPLQFFPALDRWANLLSFPVKSSVLLYSDRKPRACQKLGNGPGVGKCPAPGQHKIRKCPAVGRGRGGGSGGLGAAWIDRCITYEFCFTCFKVEFKKSNIFHRSSNETLEYINFVN